MEITPEAFRAFGGNPLTEYAFAVEVWSLQSGAQPLNPAKSLPLRPLLFAATFAAPIFDILVPLLPGQSVPKIVSSQDVSLTVDLKNYRSNDPRLAYSWDVSPKEKFNSNSQICP